MDNVKNFKKIATELGELYKVKDRAYGSSFADTYKKLGIISAVTRISDKYNRLCNLATNPDIDNLGESIEDTLRDMASYCIMTLIEMRGENQSPIGYDPVEEVDNLISSIKDDKKIRKGDMFECIEDVIMDDGEVSYVKGKVYASEVNGCITDEQHCKNHHWDCEAEYDCWYNCFKRL